MVRLTDDIVTRWLDAAYKINNLINFYVFEI